ncbi:DUF3907 family protein [Sediminibacillus albus]|uniref:DUF3907 domain-containing protein n=1 Tax=Sediminibacillus albus TaxID=407036 RepID=A0A1G8VMW2_9BACI|nr:DUF3907 family protein [Sediminibacillus albus]SDJ66530.1 Protein of unknown function [Sediminibacillus albus]
MSKDFLYAHVKEVNIFLVNSLEEMSGYLNNRKLEDLLQEEGSGDAEYYKELLKALRRLEVFCDEAHDAVNALLRENPLRETAAEKTLHGIYRQCILGFYAPKNDVWYEDSRAAYTGRRKINYHKTPPLSFARLLDSLDGAFEEIREELGYYDTKNQANMS